MLQIERQAALAAIEGVERRAHVGDLRRPVPRVVAGLRVFELVDLRAEGRKDERAERPWEEARQIENPNSAQGLHAAHFMDVAQRRAELDGWRPTAKARSPW